MSLAVRQRRIGMIAAILACLGPNVGGLAEEPGGSARGLGDLARMSPEHLEALFARSSPGEIPRGRVRGLALVRPGTKMAPILSRGARLAWQGKVFDGDGRSSVNRFFGVKAVRAEVAYGPSWRDGNPAIILDYGRTSKVYAPYRDELREVAPGLYLGLMFDRRTSPPGLKMYFAIQTVD